MAKKRFQDYFKDYLNHLPVFQAFFRAIEAENMAGFKAVSPGDKILDLGCGDGTFTRYFINNNRQIIGADIDPKALKLAGKKGIYRRLVKAEAAKLPFANGEFDMVLANSCLEHMDQLELVLREINRVLKKGGRLWFSVPSEKRPVYFIGYRYLNAMGLKKAAERVSRWQNRLVDHRTCWSDQQWRRALAKAGFTKFRARYCGSVTSCALADWLMVLSAPAWLEKKAFGYFLPWRKMTGPVFFQLLKNWKDKTKGKQGAVLVMEAIK